MQPNPDNLRIRKRAILLSLIIGTILFLAKIVGFLLPGSVAIFSDASESIVNLLAASFAMYSILLSFKPADRNHPYGHGKIEFFSAGFEGALILVASLIILYQAIRALISPPPLPHLGIGTSIIVIAGIVNLLLGKYLVSVGEQQGSLTLVADGKHLITDAYTSAGVVIGLVLVIFTHWQIVDPLIALLVATNIMITGIKLIRQSVGGLMDEVDQEFISRTTQLLNQQRQAEWIDIHRMRCWKSGEITHLDFHVTLPYYLDIIQSHKIEKGMQKLFAEMSEKPIQLLVHQDPCVSTCCSFCGISNCEVRQAGCVEQKHFAADEIVQDVPYLREKN